MTSLKNSKNLKIIIGVLVSILLLLIVSFGIYFYLDSKAQKQADIINPLLSGTSFDNCSQVLVGDFQSFQKNKYIDQNKLSEFEKTCRQKFSLKNILKTKTSCKTIISSNNKDDLKNDFIFLDGYDELKKECISQFQKISFSTGSFFDVENDFKSELYLSFAIDFFRDLEDVDDDKFIENRINAKKRLIDSLQIEPKVELSVDDVVLYPRSATLYLKLEPETTYSIKPKYSKIVPKKQEFDSKKLPTLKKAGTREFEKKEIKPFVFKTPKNKYLGIKNLNPVSLYMTNKLPKLQILDYDSGKNSVFVKVCRIDEETYNKIDLLIGRPSSAENRDFFINGIDKLKTDFCKKKQIILREENTASGNLDKFIKKDFDLKKELGFPAKTGLYYLTFDNYIDREFNSRLQKPILFGIIDSHITAKISRNGEVFFFVNDFDGKPLAGQKIEVYINEFKSKQKDYNRQKGDYEEKYFSPLEKNVLSKPILLGTTKQDGTLKVNIKDKVQGYFEKTFSNAWDYDWSGVYNAMFIKSSFKNNLSYNSSKWNAGIAPWNFGYKISSYWWGDDDNKDAVSLERWGEIEPDYYSHIFTDRVLYLPGEKVNFKAIIRNSFDLSIKKSDVFSLKIKDSKQKEIYSKDLKTNDFGSIFDNLVLDKKSPLGYYTIILSKNDKQIGTATFSVEVFKNPKFKTDIALKTYGLEAQAVKIDNVKKVSYRREEYSGKFSIKANISSSYYNGAKLSQASYSYKVYKQPYYDNSWWGDCFYGCYWEPEKEFYTSGEGKLDANGTASINVDVDFKSSYDDYKYIFEVTVKDVSGDVISSSNSVVVKLPDQYKKYNRNFDLSLKAPKRFYKVGEKFKISGELKGGKWTKYFDDKYILIIKKKDYIIKKVKDVRGYVRTINSVEEKLKKILFINSKNFNITNDGKLEFEYSLDEPGEYVFEYGNIDDYLKLENDDDIYNIVKEFEKTKAGELEVSRKYERKFYNKSKAEGFCVGKDNCKVVEEQYERKRYSKSGGSYMEKYSVFKVIEIRKEKLELDELLDYEKKYFSLLAYGDTNAKNPIINDNKLQVFAEKTVYHPGEKARVLVRLPFSKGKILLTIEKQGVVKKELIDVKSNIFFKEFVVDDSFIPNAYIGVVAMPTVIKEGTGQIIVPEYKVGYTEIVVDKTDKKSFITIKSNKKAYSPREEVVLDLEVKNKKGQVVKSELTVMVVDDSLISLMGNIDTNTLEKIYKKLPFQIQTSLTNLAMLKNYYFSRPGIVGGSGFGNFKGGDSVVSTRNIFKNTAYYNPFVITDDSGKAQVKFNLPDNLTNFRIIVLANSKDNFFGAGEEFIKVRKNVLLEPKVPLILRSGDKIKIGANIFNNTDKKIGFKVLFKSNSLLSDSVEQKIEVEPNKSKFVYFDIQDASKDCDINEECLLDYSISALGDSAENSDKYEGTITLKKSPVLINTISKNGVVEEEKVLDIELKIPENTDLDKSRVEVIFSNNRLVGIEKIIKSLIKYPYGCIEQTTSSTLPNAILKKFTNIFKDIDVDKTKVGDNIEAGIKRIKSMQTKDGGFAYWQGEEQSNLHITPYVLRSLIYMRNIGVSGLDEMIDKSKSYLEKNFKDSDTISKAEILWTLSTLKKGYLDRKKQDELGLENLTDIFEKQKLNRHSLIALTYALVLTDKDKYKQKINENIEKIKELLDSEKNYSWYWNETSDKAIFASMLMDYSYELSYIDELITELYDRDWESYYYSTQSKNNAFMAFAKYIEKFGNNHKNKFGFMLGKVRNPEKLFWVGKVVPSIKRVSYSLREVYDGEKLFFRTANIEGGPLYSTLVLKQYPKDVEKIKAYSNGVRLEKKIYVVNDSSKMDECEKAKNSYYNRGKDISNLKECKGVYSLHTKNTFDRQKLYKAEIQITFKDSKHRTNVVLEDYLASGIKVLNSKFKTESIQLKQNSTKQSYRWNHIEVKPEVVFAVADNVWGDKLNFEYFFRPEFSGQFVSPPTTAYMMYNPETRVNTKFKKIEIK